MRGIVLSAVAVLVVIGLALSFALGGEERGAGATPVVAAGTGEQLEAPAELENVDARVPAPVEAPAVARERLEVSLRTQPHVLLSVLDVDRTALAGVRVVAFEGDEVLHATSTDDDGQALLPAPERPAEVVAWSRRLPLVREPLAVGEGERTLVLGAGSTLSGWLVVDGHAPREELGLVLESRSAFFDADALPHAVREALADDLDEELRTLAARTDARGAFRFRGLPTGWKGGELRIGDDWFFVDDDSEVNDGIPDGTKPVAGLADDLVLAIGHVVRVRGRAVNPVSGEPIANGKVAIRHEDGGSSSSYSQFADEGGVFELRVEYPVVEHLALVVAAPRGGGERTIELPPNPRLDGWVWDLGDVESGRFHLLDVLVLDTEGEPVEDAVVSFKNEHVHWFMRNKSDPTGADGRTSFEIDGGQETVNVLAPGFVPEVVDVPLVPPDPFEVVLSRGNLVEVVVRNTLGDLGDGVQVKLASDAPLFEITGSWIAPDGAILRGGGGGWSSRHGPDGGSLQLAVDAEGVLAISALTPHNPMTVSVTDAHGFPVAEREEPGLGEDEHRTVEFELALVERVLAGVVLDPDGAPLEGVEVALGRLDGDGHVSTTSDAEGRFSVRGFIAAHVRVTATKDGYAPCWIEELRVPPEGEDVELRMPAPRAVLVRVVDDAGAPVGAGRVYAHIEGAFTARLRPEDAATGEHVFGAVPPGTLTFTLRIAGTTQVREHDSDVGELVFVAPRTVPLEVTVERDSPRVEGERLYVRIVRADGGEGSLRRWFDSSGEPPYRVSFDAVLPGAYEARLETWRDGGRGHERVGDPVALTVGEAGPASVVLRR